MKTILIALLTLTSLSAMGNDYNSKTCRFVDMEKNFKTEAVLETFDGNLKAEKLTVQQLLALSSFVNAVNTYDYMNVKNVGEALDQFDQKELYITKLTDKKTKKQYYYFDVYAGDNAAGFFSTLSGKKIVAENGDGDIYCLK